MIQTEPPPRDRRRRVLLVEWRVPSRDRLGDELERAGYDVTVCPGPSAPEYTCIGGRGEACPLATAADVVVLDLRLQSDEMDMGVPGWQLALVYRELGKPLVALTGESDPVRLVREPGVAVLPRRPAPDVLLDAVRRVFVEADEGSFPRGPSP